MLRGGAGRFVLTPYFLCANVLVILFLTLKYWSASNYEFELLNKVHLLEIELKSCKTLSLNCGGEFKHTSKNLQTCQEDFQTLQNKYDKLGEDLKLKTKELDQLKKKNEDKASGMEEISKKCAENLEECQASEDKCTQNLKNTELSLVEARAALENCSLNNGGGGKGGNESSLVESMKQTINELNTELLELKGHVKIKENNGDEESFKNQSDHGQLPNIKPESVVVKSKPVNGMKFHTDEAGKPIPLLPRGDPEAPRPGPRFSVMDPPAKDASNLKSIQLPLI
eukprot:TRINITY_DN1479_c0_g1_i3.p1 TRINITY_DN1479_c0_g1~~TRINITY_DN1479_c0_g1_i3.p1  ORF type:complete len:283 (+),score=78.84 TRINITY_DN1479_c0_g1_i3:97-945(+)